MQYHVWRFNDRRRQLTMVTSKPISRWDDADEPAVWKKRSGANMWGLRRYGKGGYKVFECDNASDGPGKCGMGKSSHE